MIRVEHLYKQIDKNEILKDVSMHVPKGSIYGLVGPNGAGKTTLIRHIVGSMRADAGTVTVLDEPIWQNVLVKQKIAFIPDEIFYHVTDTMLSLMKFYQSLYPSFQKERFMELLTEFPSMDTKKLLRSYSKGMQRQAAFLLSLCINPAVLVLDEPLDGLDPVVRRKILSIIAAEVANEKMTVLISSHNLRELEDICDHVGIMKEGRLIKERSLSMLQSSVCKVQVAFAEQDKKLPDELCVMHESCIGKVQTLIVQNNAQEVEAILRPLSPLLLEMLPLTLEEIFIYEMGGVEHETESVLF